jgi:hypothetical protein
MPPAAVYREPAFHGKDRRQLRAVSAPGRRHRNPPRVKDSALTPHPQSVASDAAFISSGSARPASHHPRAHPLEPFHLHLRSTISLLYQIL